MLENGIARFEKRLFSYLVDFILPLAGGILTSLLFLKIPYFPWFVIFIFAILFTYFYYLFINLVLMAIFKYRTLGMIIFKTKMIKNDGSEAAFKDCVVKCLYLGLVPFSVINAIYMITVHTEITLFDKMTNTLVVEVND